MSINTADFAALAVTVVLFAVIYYLDYKKGVDFGLLTLLGTVFGIAVGLGFGNHFTYVEIFGHIYTNVLTALVVPMLSFWDGNHFTYVIFGHIIDSTCCTNAVI